MPNEKLSLEEKVDLILKYHRSDRFWARVKLTIYAILVFVFIVLPIIWTISFINSFTESDTYKRIESLLKDMRSPAAFMIEIGKMFQNDKQPPK